MALQRDEEVEFLQDQRVVAGLAELARSNATREDRNVEYGERRNVV